MGIEISNELKKCPVCGGKAFIAQDMPDGQRGWSIGCSVYSHCDGAHYKPMRKSGFNSRKEAIAWWSEQKAEINLDLRRRA